MKNETVSGVAQKVADSGMRFLPGRWETTMTFTKLDMPNLPPEAQKAMGQAMGKARTISSCLTKAEAEKPQGKFFGQVDKSCKYDTFTMGGGTIDAKMSCHNESHAQTMVMHGTYGPQSYEMTVDVDGKGPGGQPMTMTMGMTSKRVGDCTGKEDG